MLDEHTLAFPSYDGNGMYLSVGNLALNPHVGMLFVDFAGRPPRRLRVNGVASVAPRPAARRSGAQLVVRVRGTEVFPNCPRYIHRMEPAERSPYVPRAGTTPPVPEWKRADWARDVLPRPMKLLLNIIWLVFGGLVLALGYARRRDGDVHPDHHDPVRRRVRADRAVLPVAVRARDRASDPTRAPGR